MKEKTKRTKKKKIFDKHVVSHLTCCVKANMCVCVCVCVCVRALELW